LAGGTGLGAGFEDSHVVRREVQAHHLIEESGGFTGRKAQVRLAQFGQLTTRAQASQGQRRGGAGSEHQMQLRRQMVEQKGEGVVDGFGLYHVVVIEDEGKRVWDGCNLIGQGCQNRFNRRWLRRLERTQYACPAISGDGSLIQNISFSPT